MKVKFSKEKELRIVPTIQYNKTRQRLEPHLDLFEISEDGGLHYEGKFLTKRNGELREIGVIADALGITRLCEMCFNISRTSLKARYVLDLIEKQIELPSMSDVAKTDDIELQEIMENAARRTDLIAQFEVASQGQVHFEETLPMHDLLGLNSSGASEVHSEWRQQRTFS